MLGMNQPIISLIVAHDQKLGIGFQGRIPWHLPSDLKRFKAITLGHPIIMGRKTFESIGRPLPYRTNIVVSRNSDFVAEGCEVANSLDTALVLAEAFDPEEIFVIGGEEIYRLALLFADRLYVTIVEGTFEADAFFPEYAGRFTRVISREQHEENGVKFEYVTLEKS